MARMTIEPGDFPYPLSDGPRESRYLTWVRNHSNYLTPRGFLDYLRAAAVLIRGILINFLILLPMLLIGGLLLSAWHYERLHGWLGASAPGDSPFRYTPWVLLAALVYFLLFPVVIRLFKVARQRPGIRQGGESSVKARDLYERTFGGTLLVVAVVAAVEALPLLIHWFHNLKELGGMSREAMAGCAAGSSVVALSLAGRALAVLGRFKKPLAMTLIGILGLLLPTLVILYVAEYLVYSKGSFFEAGWLVLVVVVALLALSAVFSIYQGWRNVGFKQTRFILLLLLLILMVGGGLVMTANSARSDAVDANWLFVVAAAVVLWLFNWLAVDINLTSVNGFYRDRLASSYLVGQNTGGDVDIEEDVNLVSICQYDNGSTAPYHLVNVALNLQGSKNISIRDRNSDFFIFSKKFIGGGMTGYCHTDDLEAVFPQMDLATAMAISAAAASPNMGRGTSAPLVAMMTLFNVRLGYWVPNPGHLAKWVAALEEKEATAGGPGPSPAKWSFEDVFRTELEEIRARWKNAYTNGDRRISDRTDPTPEHGLFGVGFSGGGIRSATVNMGIVQALHDQGVFNHADYMSTVSGGGYLGSSISTLMRAKGPEAVPPNHKLLTLPNRFRWRIPPRAFLKEMWSRLDETHDWVNLSDGGHIENLATIELLRRRCKYIITGDAEADPTMHFGGMAALIRFARIDLGIDIDIDLSQVHVPRKPGLKRRDRLSRQHFAIGRITYPGESEHGYLLYFKSSITGDEDEVVAEYRSRKSTFPHESTADQFFDEGQFEAYRALGEHMGRKALAASSGSKDTYAGLEAWFGELADQLPHRW